MPLHFYATAIDIFKSTCTAVVSNFSATFQRLQHTALTVHNTASVCDPFHAASLLEKTNHQCSNHDQLQSNLSSGHCVSRSSAYQRFEAVAQEAHIVLGQSNCHNACNQHTAHLPFTKTSSANIPTLLLCMGKNPVSTVSLCFGAVGVLPLGHAEGSKQKNVRVQKRTQGASPSR